MPLKRKLSLKRKIFVKKREGFMDILENPLNYIRPRPKGFISELLSLPGKVIKYCETKAMGEMKTQLRWLPGLPDNIAFAVLDRLDYLIDNKKTISLGESRYLSKEMEPLARMNFYATILRRFENLNNDVVRESVLNILNDCKKIDCHKLNDFFNNRAEAKNKRSKITPDKIDKQLIKEGSYYLSVIMEKLDSLESRELVNTINFLIEELKSLDNKLEKRRFWDEITKRYEREANVVIDREEESLISLARELKHRLELNSSDDTIKFIVNKIAEVIQNLESVVKVAHKLRSGESRFLNLEPYAELYTAAFALRTKYKKYYYALFLLWNLLNRTSGSHFESDDISNELRDLIFERSLSGDEADSGLAIKFNKFEKKINKEGDKKFTIDEKGVIWDGESIEFGRISGLTWGRSSDKNESGDALYRVVLEADDYSRIVLDIDNNGYYNYIVNRILYEIGGEIARKILNKLKSGGNITYEEYIFTDDKLFQNFTDENGVKEIKGYEWDKIEFDSSPKAFDIKITKLDAGYDKLGEIQFLDNIHSRFMPKILDKAKRLGSKRLSDILDIKSDEF
jgi:hypothetical protein